MGDALAILIAFVFGIAAEAWRCDRERRYLQENTREFLRRAKERDGE